MSPDGGVSPQALRARIHRYYGGDCRIRAVRSTARPGAFLFVLDAVQRGRLVRTLGTIGRGGGSVMEHSALDLARPERLVFNYEREMLVALAVVARPTSALLLGLGGGAMCRHLAAYLPGCELTVVERDPIVRALARRFFHIRRPVVMADAEHAVAGARAQFDVILVDCYDSRGATAAGMRFWRACLRALKPNGCLAANWADFAGATTAEGEAARLSLLAERSFFVSEPIREPNVVQYVPTLKGFRRTQLSTRLRQFAAAHGLPREDRDILKRCRLISRYEDAEDDVD